MDFLRKLIGQKIINFYHLAMALFANFVYGFPSRNLHVIGVTGTDGKTTTANLIASILRSAGFTTAHLSTVNGQVGNKIYDTGLHTTTPNSFFLQKFFAKAVAAGCRYVVLEATSHALDQHRTWGIDFETAVLTNVSHEHLDYHNDLEAYMLAKVRLFQNVKFGILNIDDQSYGFFSKHLEPEQLLSYGLTPKAEISADNLEESLTETQFTAHVRGRGFPVALNLPGRFNVYNALAAIAVGMIYEVPTDQIQKGLAAVKVIDGRLEMVGDRVMVDFAHTPNAIEQLLAFLQPKIQGKLIHVFGAAGERDASKRVLMGAASDKYADLIILTREDNRSENVQEICQQIAKGIKGKKLDEGYFIIPDRREAISFALKFAKGSADFVVVTGKGHEQSLNIDGQEVPWDDRTIAREELKK